MKIGLYHRSKTVDSLNYFSGVLRIVSEDFRLSGSFLLIVRTSKFSLSFDEYLKIHGVSSIQQNFLA